MDLKLRHGINIAINTAIDPAAAQVPALRDHIAVITAYFKRDIAVDTRALPSFVLKVVCHRRTLPFIFLPATLLGGNEAVRLADGL